jgi:hypothetical protein
MAHRNRMASAARRSAYRHRFVDTLPDNLEEGVLYVSGQYATSAHKCFCGCGREVITPIHPTKWRLTFDGIHVSLHPSVGSWSLPCKSHYWLQAGNVAWSEAFTEKEIETVRARDLVAQDHYFSGGGASPPAATVAPTTAPLERPRRWSKVVQWFRGS